MMTWNYFRKAGMANDELTVMGAVIRILYHISYIVPRKQVLAL